MQAFSSKTLRILCIRFYSSGHVAVENIKSCKVLGHFGGHSRCIVCNMRRKVTKRQKKAASLATTAICPLRQARRRRVADLLG